MSAHEECYGRIPIASQYRSGILSRSPPLAGGVARRNRRAALGLLECMLNTITRCILLRSEAVSARVSATRFLTIR